jgi:hypothetical protein
MKINSSQSAEIRARWKIVRKDSYKDVPGEIMEADETTGVCTILIGGESKKMEFGANSIVILPRKVR